MRFREFFTEAEADLQPGYSLFAIPGGDTIQIPSTIRQKYNDQQILGLLKQQGYNVPAVPQVGQGAKITPPPSATPQVPAAPVPGQASDAPPGHVLVRSPTGQLIYVKQEFTDGKGKLTPHGLELLNQQHSKLAVAAKVPEKLKEPMMAAKQQADQYLGRALTDVEWDALVRVANAEASHQPQEQAWVIASVLNSVRRYKNSVYDEIMKKNRMQSVTGSKVDPTASPNFTNTPPATELSSIFKAASSILPTIPKNVMHFTSANELLYAKEKGTSNDWFKKLTLLYNATKNKSNPPGTFAVKVGGSIFATDFDPVQVLKLAQKPTVKPIKSANPGKKA